MRRLNNCIFIVIFIAILISGWSLDRRIATARVFLHHVANQLPSSPEVVAEEHKTVDKMQINYQEELVELKKTIQILNYDFKRVVKARSTNEGHKSQLELIASLATTIGASLFVITIVLLVCANNDEVSPRKVETSLLCQSEEFEKDGNISETREQENGAPIKEDAQDTTLAGIPTETVVDAPTSFISKLPSLKPTSFVAKMPSLKPTSLIDKIPSLKPTSLVDKVPSLKPPRVPVKEFVVPNNNVVVVPPPPPANPRPPPPPTNSVPPPPPPSCPANSKGPAPPAPPPNPRAPPAPPLGGARGPPAPPPKGGGPRAPTSSANAVAPSNRTKLKPFFWDKVQASPQQSMVWDEIRAGSFQFNEEMIENLFGFSPDEKKGNDRKAKNASAPVLHLIEAKKSQNLSILLRALNVTTKEVCDALMQGNELPIELLQTLLKMAPTSDEELKLRLFNGDPSLISPAERFLKALVDIPFAYKRMECLLFMITLKEEVASLKESFATLEMASNKLTSSKIFLKLLEAVLKTGNRMNDGTYRGGAQAFKLDTLLKLGDVKGKDGKTTLLHFLVQEIVRSEGRKVVRAARDNCSVTSVSSISSDDFIEDATSDPMENILVLGLQKVSGLSTELEVVKKAAVVDSDALTSTAARLGHSLLRTKDFLNKDMRDLGEESRFYRALKDFVEESEIEITCILQEERRIMDLVKKTVEHFHGNSAKEEGLKLFGVVRDFLILLDKICAEIEKTINRPPKTNSKDNSNKKQESSSSTLPDHSTKNDSNVASTSGTSSTEEKPLTPSADLEQKNSTKESTTKVSTQESHPQTSSSMSEQLTKSLSQERAVEEMRQKLLPITQDGRSDESSSSSSDDETLESSTRGSCIEVPFQEAYLQASSANSQMSQARVREYLAGVVSRNSSQSLDDSSSSSSDGS